MQIFSSLTKEDCLKRILCFFDDTGLAGLNLCYNPILYNDKLIFNFQALEEKIFSGILLLK